jgi:hypothetical protein
MPKDSNFAASVKYNIGSKYGGFFGREQSRMLPDPIPSRDEIIPDPDSISESILTYPAVERAIDFAAYDPPEITLSPTEGAHPMSVPYHELSFETLTGGRIGLGYTTGSYTEMENLCLP